MTTPKPEQSKRPTHIAYHVREKGQDDGFWTRIGCAWKHANGEGFNVQLDTVPLDGRIVIRIASAKSI